MNRALIGLLIASLGTVAGLSAMASRHVDKIRPNTFVGPVAVGGLTHDGAARKLRQWWEMERVRELKVSVRGSGLRVATPASLGLSLDDEASVEGLPLEGFWQSVGTSLGQGDDEVTRRDPAFDLDRAALEPLRKAVATKIGHPRAPRAFWREDRIVLEPEVPGYDVDAEALLKVLVATVQDAGEAVEVPLREAEKRIPDDMLLGITEVVSQFHTTFSSSNRPRSANIKLASEKFDGIVLLPGDRVSYNGTVGKRTTESGFQIAGVYVNGRHDFDVGGGICQVSTTLYNAALLANLKIVARQNHSMPVPYVPVGRDATVHYGAIDLVFENTFDRPIAIATEYKPGRLTFRVLGAKVPGEEVKIVSEGHRSWPTEVKTVVDPKLKPGQTKVVEKGSAGHDIRTFRLVYREGKLIAKEPLGRSYYKGGAKIIAVGPAQKKSTPAPSLDDKPLATRGQDSY